MSKRKKLIEVALPLEAINDASVRESYIYKGNPSSIHKWWAQRPLAASRAVIFASLIDDPNNKNASKQYINECKLLLKGKNASDEDTPRQRLFDFIEKLVSWESATNKKIIDKARLLIELSTNNSPPKLFDPFAGGGTIPLEAKRLGLKSYANDLNPVSVMINKALLDIPARFVDTSPINQSDQNNMMNLNWDGLAGFIADFNYYSKKFINLARKELGYLYPDHKGENVISWLWARTIKCPNPACKADIPLLRDFWLSKKDNRHVWLEPVIDKENSEFSFAVKSGEGSPPDPIKMGRGANFKCLVCGKVAAKKAVKNEFQQGRDGKYLLAIVTDSSSGRNYWEPTPEHREIANSCEPEWMPVYEMNPESNDLISSRGYGFRSWHELFTKRQLYTLSSLKGILDQIQNEILEDGKKAGRENDGIVLENGGDGLLAYSEAIRTYLVFAINKYIMYGNSLVPWYKREDRPSMLFTRQAIPMVWDFVEVNPLSEIGGSLSRSCEIIADVLKTLPVDRDSKVYMADAATFDLGENQIMISTDPPYYDNIMYGDLSDFFYIWMRYYLSDEYPNVFKSILVPKNDEIVAPSHRFNGDDEKAKYFFEKKLYKTFMNIRQYIDEEYPLTIYYAFKQKDLISDNSSKNTGWETMLNSLVSAGFKITGTWPIRTERKGRMIASGTNALASSIILVCRKRGQNADVIARHDFIRMLKNELPRRINEMQSGNIAPVDMAQASIGPGMEIFSRYKKVLEPDGDSMTIRTALKLINQELDMFLSEQEGVLDSDSRFAVDWFKQYRFNEGPFGKADVLARAKNTSVEGLVRAGILKSKAGNVCLYKWDSLDSDWNPEKDRRMPTWEVTHYLIKFLDEKGEEGLAKIMARLSSEIISDSRNLAYRLYNICENKGWPDIAHHYNSLITSWRESQEQAQKYREQYTQEEMF